MFVTLSLLALVALASAHSRIALDKQSQASPAQRIALLRARRTGEAPARRWRWEGIGKNLAVRGAAAEDARVGVQRVRLSGAAKKRKLKFWRRVSVSGKRFGRKRLVVE